MRPVVLVGLLVLALSAPATAVAPETDLVIRVWPNGQDKADVPRRWTLRCSPAGGTLPRATRACRLLYGQSRPFRPVPRNVACAEIYGGPAVAQVRGTYRGRSINAWFKRTDSCQIARWTRVRFLFVAR